MILIVMFDFGLNYVMLLYFVMAVSNYLMLYIFVILLQKSEKLFQMSIERSLLNGFSIQSDEYTK